MCWEGERLVFHQRLERSGGSWSVVEVESVCGGGDVVCNWGVVAIARLLFELRSEACEDRGRTNEPWSRSVFRALGLEFLDA